MRYMIIVLLIGLLSGCGTPRHWTKKEKTLLVASCIATFADAKTTIDGMHRGCSETNPIMGRYPSDAKVISVMAITQALTILITHYYPNLRWTLGVKAGVNGSFAWHNSRTK